MMYGWYGGMGIWGWILMALVMLAFWGGVVALVVFAVRNSRGGPGRYDPRLPGSDDPERILAQRFARGEIDETEFRARLDALRHRP
ncbi:hypothetical protein SCMU_37170 [Sinomonas cyclohexanicum]|uniref:SHOCT domain-containing protein n=2 Tax=Sinomonas cyclohexanicum TaxID=322009 RepID=A0ABM7PZY2_SINCY|nr:SHOCT domain-containing protein [Corynebacterium cyclohexanicum]BCT77875.1 hypothetical protein SCMU_37170 [Corynebacterium cyclohexanicum]